MLRTVTATRYVTPLREGGSLPALVEGDDDGLYVLKFRGAGQGVKALIAEVVAGEIGRALGLAVPEIVLMEVDPSLGRSEGDPEIQALLKASVGLNLALDFLPSALSFEAAATPTLDPTLASTIVWFDAYVTNVDRTARNTNMLLWGKRLWLIDHGATLFFHHTWVEPLLRSRSPFAAIRDHVLLPAASHLAAVDPALRARLPAARLAEIVAAVPDLWLADEPRFSTPARHRAAYVEYLVSRLAAASIFVEEAERARALLI